MYYVEVCKRINMFAVGTYKEYFTSKAGRDKYLEEFQEYLYIEGEMWIKSTGTARVNAHDHIVPDKED